MAKGEQRELAVKGLKNFSVGNKEVLATHLRQGKILLKGRQVGYSDLVVWGAEGRQQYQVYILSKASFLKTAQLTEALKGLGLELDLKGPLVMVRGQVDRYEDWQYLLHLKSQHQDKVVFQVELSAQLRRYLVTEVYRELFRAGLTRVACRAYFLELECEHEAPESMTATLSPLAKRWHIRFHKRESSWAKKNLRLKLKLIQLESMDGREISLGLSALRGTPSGLFKEGLRRLIEENQIALAENHLELSTLAEPEAMVRINRPHLIEVGAQIPYQNIRPENGTVLAPIDWRFAGLKVSTQLSEREGQLVLDYETEFTRPTESSISGSKERSSILLTPGLTYKLFQIGYRSRTEDTKHLPGLKDVPILRTLFGARESQASYKRIEGYLIVEEE